MRLPLVSSALSLLSLSAALPASQDIEPRQAASSFSRSVMYVQTFRTTSGGQFSLLPLVNQSTAVTHVYLAAFHINSAPGDINLNDNPPSDAIYSTVWQEVAQLQARGVKVMMMLGGAAPGCYPRLCSGTNGAVNNDFYAPLLAIIKKYKIQGLDLDIEERVPLSCPLNLLRRLNSDLGPSFILTMAPVASDLQPYELGLGGFSYSALDRQATSSAKPNGKLVNWFNAQFYNGWGDASSSAGYNKIIQNGYSPSRVTIGLLANRNDGGSGHFSAGAYQRTLNTLRSTYSNFGSAAGWEYWNAGELDGYSPALQNHQWVRVVPSYAARARTMTTSRAKSAKRSTSPNPNTFEGLLASEASSAAPDTSTQTNSNPPVPWPLGLNKLLGAGAGFYQSVAAMNRSNGDVTMAAKQLKLANLIGDIGGIVGNVGNVLEGLTGGRG
ncbi:hypothetical protein TI39_contig278g00052 [Zymoseptoria brevis]|uniref:GH18 domain-containing protein n=1 Tax=Zymoseptoria brevis TaxID=1047168 RepID=A0A0F4GXR7_9PEZI|nr:hypothetical protein TI39_contig278g00052 [Zymoseptoria brevis]